MIQMSVKVSCVKQEVSRTIKNLKRNSSFHKIFKILNNKNVKTFLHNFQKQIIFVSIHKAATNFSFINKKTYVSKILNEIRLNGTPNPRSEFSSKTKDEIIYENSSFNLYQ